MKKYSIYIGILAVGLLLGWLLFGSSSNKETAHDHETATEMNQLWTCSMHPQIMKPDSGDCPICGMDLIPVESGVDGLLADQFRLTENAMALANIQTSIVGSGKIDDNAIKLSGKIVENEEANMVQASYFSGRVERLNVSFTGERVQKGQLLATIYSPELYAAQQELITAASLKETQPALYNAVRNKLKLWKLSENQINDIEKTRKVKENFPVYATVSGTVTDKLIEQGDYIKQGQPMLKIANLNTVWANFDVYENQIDLFKKGQDVIVKANTYANKEFKGKVNFIDPVLNTKTRTVTLRVVLNNKNDVFKPGMFVTSRIQGIRKNIKEVLTIPSSSILWTGKRSVVYVKSNSNEPIFEMREVTLGNDIGENYEVIDGLNNGEEVVTNGTFTIDAAAQLQGKKSMMNKEGGKTTTGHDGHTGLNSSEPIDRRLEVSDLFQNQLKQVTKKYVDLKNALVNSDHKNCYRISKELVTTLAAVEMRLLTDDEAHSQWMELEKIIKGASSKIAKSATIDEQRVLFIELSNTMIKAVKLFGINQVVFEQYCPMADNDQGASWISFEEEIKNPYFGKVMLNCGNIVSEIN